MSVSESIDWVENPGIGRPSNDYYTALEDFANSLININESLDFKMSARGWAYYFENEGLIDKSDIEYHKDRINKLRKNDFEAGWDHAPLPSDFTAQDNSRSFDCVERDNYAEPEKYVKREINHLVNPHIDLSFWETQDVFIQVLVEKIDLKEIFKPICRKYNIPIATGKGWSSINQRAKILTRFNKWAKRGKCPILIYCGDFDPAGMQISNTLKKNFNDLHDALIPDGDGGYFSGWDSEEVGLTIDRIGLSEGQVEKWGFPWIDNLETSGEGPPLDSPKHSDHDQPYVQNWLDEYGVRKVEANALVTQPELGRDLFTNSVEGYLSDNPKQEYQQKRQNKKKKVQQSLYQLGVKEDLENAYDELK